MSATLQPARLRSSEPSSSRDKILDVAEGLFARRGYTGVGLREVAGAAGSVERRFRHESVALKVALALGQRLGMRAHALNVSQSHTRRCQEHMPDVQHHLGRYS